MVSARVYTTYLGFYNHRICSLEHITREIGNLFDNLILYVILATVLNLLKKYLLSIRSITKSWVMYKNNQHRIVEVRSENLSEYFGF